MIKCIFTYLTGLLLSASVLAQDGLLSEEILILNDSIQLPGTLSFKPEMEKQPLVIFIQGSGNPDRDGNQLAMNIKANYIKQLAEALNEKNIAIFRYDKRNVTTANHKYILSDYSFDHLVDDAKSVIQHFRTDKRFGSMVILGHSQGSLVGMLALEAGGDKFISLAGLGKSADEAMVWQISKQNKDLALVAEAHFKELKETDSIEQINPFLVSIFAPANHQFLKNYIQYDPKVEIAKVTIPTLIINGDKDIQVTEEDADLLYHARRDAELIIIPGMNHVLKHIEKEDDNMKSYFSEDYPVSEKLITVLTEFIKNK